MAKIRLACCPPPMAIDPIHIKHRIEIPGSDLSLEYARSGGPGGQHVNTTDTAVRMRFDLAGNTTLHPAIKARIQAAHANDITKEGELLITSQRHRSRAANVDDARDKLANLVRAHLQAPKARRATKPTKGSQKRRLKAKTKRGEVKAGRGRVRRDD